MRIFYSDGLALMKGVDFHDENGNVILKCRVRDPLEMGVYSHYSARFWGNTRWEVMLFKRKRFWHPRCGVLVSQDKQRVCDIIFPRGFRSPLFVLTEQSSNLRIVCDVSREKRIAYTVVSSSGTRMDIYDPSRMKNASCCELSGYERKDADLLCIGTAVFLRECQPFCVSG